MPEITVHCKCKARALIVDDSQFNNYPLQKMLQSRFGIKSESATNGLKAYNKVKRNLTKQCCNVVYNLICMDINMPVMNGITAADKILCF